MTDRGADRRLGASRTTSGPPPPEDVPGWSWPPYAPVESSGGPFDTPEWAPASSVEHPLLRVGRWTLLYRRGA